MKQNNITAMNRNSAIAIKGYEVVKVIRYSSKQCELLHGESHEALGQGGTPSRAPGFMEGQSHLSVVLFRQLIGQSMHL